MAFRTLGNSGKGAPGISRLLPGITGSVLAANRRVALRLPRADLDPQFIEVFQ